MRTHLTGTCYLQADAASNSHANIQTCVMKRQSSNSGIITILSRAMVSYFGIIAFFGAATPSASAATGFGDALNAFVEAAKVVPIAGCLTEAKFDSTRQLWHAEVVIPNRLPPSSTSGAQPAPHTLAVDVEAPHLAALLKHLGVDTKATDYPEWPMMFHITDPKANFLTPNRLIAALVIADPTRLSPGALDSGVDTVDTIDAGGIFVSVELPDLNYPNTTLFNSTVDSSPHAEASFLALQTAITAVTTHYLQQSDGEFDPAATPSKWTHPDSRPTGVFNAMREAARLAARRAYRRRQPAITHQP